MAESPEQSEEAGILRELSVLEGSPCAGCDRPLCGHHALVALVMGFKSAPRCADCLAAALELTHEKFLGPVIELIHNRDCYRSGWIWAGHRENVGNEDRPPCVRPAENGRGRKERKPLKRAPAGGPEPATEDTWDAGSMGCGDLVLELRLRLGRLAPGGVLRLTATDPGAPEDLPAWCRLTGHEMISMKHPQYRIRKRKES
jgi:tRNA 2-thiouridine synthesizing protein A